MAHSSNIQLDSNLMNFINKSKQDSNIRAFKIIIKDEQLELDKQIETSCDNWLDDFKESVSSIFIDKEPCFVLLRMDTKTHQDCYDWNFISWSPDNSHVRQKMLYASTKAILKLHLKSNNIISDVFATSLDELESVLTSSSNGSSKSLEPDENLLTAHEQDLRTVKREEAQASCLPKNNIHLPGVEFPIQEEAVDALLKFKNGELQFVQMNIDLTKEIIQLEMAKKKFSVNELAQSTPSKSARYILIKYPHNYEDKFYEAVLFIYWAPVESCSVKERMLYSTCKIPLLTALTDEQRFGIKISKKLEIDDPKELTSQSLNDELHPKEVTSGLKFAKPQGPSGKRGAKRLIRNLNADE